MQYRFSVEKQYKLEAKDYQEAIALLNSEKEYNFIVDESWTLLEGNSDIPLKESK